MSYTYQESLDQAERDLQAAREALPRDCAQAIVSAGWAEFLRDKHDVLALVAHVSQLFRSSTFLNELYAAGDKARQQQPRVGRPSKQAKEADQRAQSS